MSMILAYMIGVHMLENECPSSVSTDAREKPSTYPEQVTKNGVLKPECQLDIAYILTNHNIVSAIIYGNG